MTWYCWHLVVGGGRGEGEGGDGREGNKLNEIMVTGSYAPTMHPWGRGDRVCASVSSERGDAWWEGSATKGCFQETIPSMCGMHQATLIS